MINAQPKAPEKGGLDTPRLLKLMSDINGQPDWRSLANRSCAYYDGDQLPPEGAIAGYRWTERTTGDLATEASAYAHLTIERNRTG